MVNSSTYALRDSSKVNSQYTTQTKDDQGTTTAPHHPFPTTAIENRAVITYPKKRKSALYPSSDFYTTNDPQYYQLGVSSSLSRNTKKRIKKRDMTKKKTIKKKMSSRRKKRSGSDTTTTPNAPIPSKSSSSNSSSSSKSKSAGSPSNSLVYRVRSPGRNDVLCGRGGNVNNHPGNKFFRSIVSEKKNNYTLNSNKVQKTEICNAVIDRIHNLEPKGRFLTKGEGNFWVEVDHAKALSKTSQALREGAPKLRAEASSVSDGAVASRPKSKRGRKATLGKRKRSSSESRSSSRSGGKRGKYDERELEEDDTLHPLIAPLPNGHRGKQLIPRSDQEEAAASRTGSEECEETREEKENRIKKLKAIMKPRSQDTPMTPVSPPLPPLQDRSAPSLAMDELSQDPKNMIPILPESAVVKKPPGSFYRAHSLATSEDLRNSSDILPVDDDFVNPFVNETSVLDLCKPVGAASSAKTSADSGGVGKHGTVFTSPTSTAVSAAAMNSSAASTEIANINFSHSPSAPTKSNSSSSSSNDITAAATRDERSYSVACNPNSRSEPNAYRTNLSGTANGLSTGRNSINEGLQLHVNCPPLPKDEDSSSFDVLFYSNNMDPFVGGVHHDSILLSPCYE